MITTNHSQHNWVFIVFGRGEHTYPKAVWSEEHAMQDLQRYLDNLTR